MSEKNEKRRGLNTDASAMRRLVQSSTQKRDEVEKDGRGRAGNASGQIGVDIIGNAKATYYVSLPRQSLVREMAEAEESSQTDIVEAAIVMLYNAWQANTIDFEAFKEHARSLKAKWKIEVPDEFGQELIP